jgi:hypothetical protein
MDLPDPMRLACIEQDPLGGSGLSGVNVSHNADISYVMQIHVYISNKKNPG